jgi:hypothetical protein
MLPSEKNDLLYLLNILEYIGKIWKYTEEANDAEELFELNERLNLNASLTLLANIGENVSKLSDTLKQEYPNENCKLLDLGFGRRIALKTASKNNGSPVEYSETSVDIFSPLA